MDGNLPSSRNTHVQLVCRRQRRLRCIGRDDQHDTANMRAKVRNYQCSLSSSKIDIQLIHGKLLSLIDQGLHVIMFRQDIIGTDETVADPSVIGIQSIVKMQFRDTYLVDCEPLLVYTIICNLFESYLYPLTDVGS